MLDAGDECGCGAKLVALFVIIPCSTVPVVQSAGIYTFYFLVMRHWGPLVAIEGSGSWSCGLQGLWLGWSARLEGVFTCGWPSWVVVHWTKGLVVRRCLWIGWLVVKLWGGAKDMNVPYGILVEWRSPRREEGLLRRRAEMVWWLVDTDKGGGQVGRLDVVMREGGG